jgi:hypothetical protein
MRREFAILSDYRRMAEYPIGEDGDRLVLFVNLDARNSFDVYQIQGTKREILWLRIPKISTELSFMRRQLAK